MSAQAGVWIYRTILSTPGQTANQVQLAGCFKILATWNYPTQRQLKYKSRSQ